MKLAPPIELHPEPSFPPIYPLSLARHLFLLLHTLIRRKLKAWAAKNMKLLSLPQSTLRVYHELGSSPILKSDDICGFFFSKFNSNGTCGFFFSQFDSNGTCGFFFSKLNSAGVCGFFFSKEKQYAGMRLNLPSSPQINQHYVHRPCFYLKDPRDPKWEQPLARTRIS